MKFILSRTDDRSSRPKKWIVGYALLFWLITRIIAAGAIIGCTAVYNSFGLNPETLTQFGGSPAQAGKMGSLADVALMVMIIAPVLEEGVFRLGLSFRKWQVALSLALIPMMVIWMRHTSFGAVQYAACIGSSALIFCGIYFGTRQATWSRLKAKYLVAASWVTALAFGFCHLLAFSTLTWELLPYCLCVISMPFFAGCACTYLRVNLGYWWGVGLHIFNNIPALLMVAAMP